MELNNAISTLRREAQSNPTAKAVFSNFAQRTRSWDNVSLRSLWVTLNEGKTKYPVGEVAEVLRLIASVGLGKGHANNKGRIIRVSQLAMDLRELGGAVVGDSKNIKKYMAEREERGFDAAAIAVASAPTAFKVYPMRKASNLSITLTINGNPVIMPLPDNLTPDELQTLIERLKKTEDGYGK